MNKYKKFAKSELHYPNKCLVIIRRYYAQLLSKKFQKNFTEKNEEIRRQNGRFLEQRLMNSKTNFLT